MQHCPCRRPIEDLLYNQWLGGRPQQWLDPHCIPPSDGRKELAKPYVEGIIGLKVNIQSVEL